MGRQRWIVLLGVLALGCGGTTKPASEDEPDILIDFDSGVSADITPPPKDTVKPIDEIAAPTDTSLEGDCTPGEKACADKKTAHVCRPDGKGWNVIPCGNGTVCAAGKCQLVKCTAGEPTGKCSSQGATEVCNANGTGTELEYCTAVKPICVEGVCKDLKCQPGSVQCKGTGAVEKCKDDGSAYEIDELCGEGHTCKEAKCVTACDADIKENTYIGCEYWAIDLDNIEGGLFQNVAVVVSNPSPTDTATITINNFSTSTDLSLPTQAVPPLGQQIYELPKGYDLNGSVLTNKTFRLKSTKPVIVHQFNPRNAIGVYSNDASLLLPSNTAGKEFLVQSWPQRQADSNTGFIPLRGFVAIIAVEKGTTQVTVIPTVNIEAGEGVPPMAAYTPNVITLEYGHVVQLETGGGLSGPDLTGTSIVSDKRVNVFGGHECANVPLIVQDGVYMGTDWCDHVEQQLVPLDAWGKEYIADAFIPRSPAQFDVWRILAGDDGVVITTDPPLPTVNGIALDKGSFVEFQSSLSFRVTATGRISVGHFMAGSNYSGFAPAPECAKADTQTGIGDPAFTLAVATSQLRMDYIVLTPADYAQNFLNISFQTGTTIEIDGVVTPLADVPLGGSTWTVAQLPVAAGVHVVKGSALFGLTVYGYDCDVSYAYPGGLNVSTQTP